ncbi:MAG: hypothetical protein WCX46_02005 [Candidatus Paceibacterota bacterium]
MKLHKNKVKYILFIILIIVCFFFISSSVFGYNIFNSLYSYIFSTPIGNISATSCVIPVGGSNCNSTLNWSTNNLDIGVPFEVTRNNPNNTHVSFHTNSVNETNLLNYGTSSFYLYYDGVILDSASVSATCIPGSVWYLGECVMPDVCQNITGIQPSLPSGMYFSHMLNTFMGSCDCIVPTETYNQITNSCTSDIPTLCTNPPVCTSSQTLNTNTCACEIITTSCTKTCELPLVLDSESCSCKTPCISNLDCPSSPYLCGSNGFCQTIKVPHFIEN